MSFLQRVDYNWLYLKDDVKYIFTIKNPCPIIEGIFPFLLYYWYKKIQIFFFFCEGHRGESNSPQDIFFILIKKGNSSQKKE